MQSSFTKFGAVAVIAAAALMLASCGRRGPLEPPPSAAAPAPVSGSPDEQPAAAGEYEGQREGNVSGGPAQAKTGVNQIPPHVPKSFPLDPLL